MQFIVALIITIIIFGLFFMYSKYKMTKFMKYEINNRWGKIQSIEKSKVNFKYVKNYFSNSKKGFFIDDITWSDLDMNDMFKSMNNTMTSVGEEVLYNILRSPLFNETSLKKREELISFFEENENLAKEIQCKLWKLGKKKNMSLSDYFYEDKKEVVNNNSKNKLILYNIFSVSPIIFAILSVFNGIFLGIIVLNIILNMYIHKITKDKYENRISDYIYMISIVNCAKKIYDLDFKEINENYPNINNNLSKLKGVAKSVFVDSTNATSDALAFNEMLNLFFLREVRTFERINKTLYKNMGDLEKVYEYVGEIDSLIAVASFRTAVNEYCRPSFKLNEKREIKFKDIYHPLIKEPVKNSFHINRCILITGSNASGKSTFLRTVAINSLFAQTIYTVFAKEYSSCFLKLYTSMALKDDMLGNESYYMVESKSLKRILDNVDEDIPVLCFVDEILRGTNTIERISASSEILNHLSKENCICIAATHDIELTYILENNFCNCHFQEKIKENNIIFDYKLYSGRSTTRNAIKILSLIGYNKKIVIRAEERANFFIENNYWTEIE
ncbi:MutS family DNA mismatch repair protein [Clostridium sp. Ade.TY]|uniref:MutS-related protein n=1 Tax=Clostridium sp. Ade.TY TaxID=1391647 RepID=UPI000418F134|nr:MutS family DNA mismatch repair protein [Clostridium sp. Ade.TY]